jgi:hypothetical protein
MEFPFARHVSERGHGHPKRFRFQNVELKTERVAIAYRLLFAYAFVCPESEQNSSHLQIDCDRVQAVSVRTDYTAGEVRRFAKRAKDAAQAPARVRHQAIGGLVLDIFGRNLIIAGLGQVLAAIGAALFALWLLRSVIPG